MDNLFSSLTAPLPTSPGWLLVRPVVALPLQPLQILLLPHLVVRHLLNRERRRVRRQLRQRPVERQPERLAQSPSQLRNWFDVQTFFYLHLKFLCTAREGDIISSRECQGH